MKNFYLEHISFYALLEDIGRTNKVQTEENGEVSHVTDADLKVVSDASLRHACETVCGIIEGIFEVIANAPSEG